MVARRQRRLPTMAYFYNRYNQFIIRNCGKKHLWHCPGP